MMPVAQQATSLINHIWTSTVVSAGFNKIAVEAQEIRKKSFSFREYYK